MGYEVGLQADILALLHLFRDRVPDRETNGWVTELATDQGKWPGAHDLFDLVRKRLLVAEGDARRASIPKDGIAWARVYQYAFEELCLKTLFNETNTSRPFDSCSPFWVAGSAIQLARRLGVPVEDVLTVIAPDA